MDPVVLSYVFINTHYKSEAATTVAYHFRIVRLDIIKKTDNSKWWQDCEKIELLYTLQVRYKMIQLLLKTFWHFLNNVNVKLPLCPSTFTPSYLPKRNKNTHSNKNWARMFIAALFTIAQKKTAQKTISWWMDKKKKKCIERNEILIHAPTQINPETCDMKGASHKRLHIIWNIHER